MDSHWEMEKSVRDGVDSRVMAAKLLLTHYVQNFSEGTKNIYLHFVSFLHVDMTQVVEILPQVRQGHTHYA